MNAHMSDKQLSQSSTGNKFGLLARLHRRVVSQRRAHRLSAHLAPLVEQGASILDVGCGYGLVASLLQCLRPDIRLSGIDITVRDDCLIPATPYNGSDFPYPDNTFDYVQFIDVLHHTDDPLALMREALRVARKGMIIKDHQVEGFLAWRTLWFLDWAGNRPYDVNLTYNFWTRKQWLDAFRELGIEEAVRLPCLGMYPAPFHFLFDRSLHFIDKLAPTGGDA